MSETIEAPAADTAPAPDPIAAIWDRAQEPGPGHNGGPELPAEAPARAPDGKFAAPAAQQTEEPAAGSEAAPAAFSPPQGWPADAALDLTQLRPAARAALLADIEAGRLHLGAPAAAAPSAPDPVVEALKPFEADLKAAGLEMREYVPRVMGAAAAMQRDPVGVLIALAQDFRVTEQIAAKLGIQPDQRGVAADPMIAELRAEVARLKHWQGSEAAERDARSSADATRQVTEFAAGKEHFELVRTQMGPMVQAGMSLDDAYTAACAVNPTVRARIAQVDEAKLRSDAAAKSAQARRGAGFNLPATSGANTARPSLEQSAGDVFDRHAGLT